VETDWLAGHLDDANVRIVDMDLPPGYTKAHLPNAAGIPNQSIKGDDSKFVMGPNEFKQVMESLGIGDDTLVIAYDSNKSLNACRLWWVLNYYGHTNVRVLNGGWWKWLAEGRTVSVSSARKGDGVTFSPQVQPAVLSTVDTLKAVYDKPDVTVWDTRSLMEYTGDNDRGNKRKGHVPGAHHLEWQDLINQDDHTFKRATELSSMLEAVGITPDKPIHTY
jgi:thiosulfate/3-mercaptopyruvate sulfurtransferase